MTKEELRQTRKQLFNQMEKLTWKCRKIEQMMPMLNELVGEEMKGMY